MRKVGPDWTVYAHACRRVIAGEPHPEMMPAAAPAAVSYSTLAPVQPAEPKPRCGFAVHGWFNMWLSLLHRRACTDRWNVAAARTDLRGHGCICLQPLCRRPICCLCCYTSSSSTCPHRACRMCRHCSWRARPCCHNPPHGLAEMPPQGGGAGRGLLLRGRGRCRHPALH